MFPLHNNISVIIVKVAEEKSFFHLFADGALSAGFILSIKDYIAVMNIIAVCAANSGATVVAFSIEDTHPHFLLFATREECVRFLEMFESIYRHFATRSRPKGFCPSIKLEMYPVPDEQSLRNVGVYVINQPTKDGKRVMPYDYPWGSGPLYFRGRFVLSLSESRPRLSAPSVRDPLTAAI